MSFESKIGTVQKRISGRDFFTLNPQSSALLIIDMQNAFVEEGAAGEIAPGRDIIPKITKLINYCREQRIPVIWTQSDHYPPYGGLLFKKSWSLVEPDRVPQRINGKGTHAFEIYNGLPEPLPNEFRVVKHKYDVFYETDLDNLLRTMKIDTLLITGVGATVCCESTARSAHCRDYKVVFTSDGTATRDPAAQKEVLARMDRIVGRVMSVTEVIAELEESRDKK